jgi:uncharacterized protein YdeI (YjbR/CyaY-like superfamily)
MGTKDTRVDAYIAHSADFAQPILSHVREVVHAACPEVEETIKWGFPHFMCNGMLCGIASFKQHCTLNFWKGALILEDGGSEEQAMGQFGRITSVSDLPPDEVLAGYFRKAMALNEAGTKAPSRSSRKAAPEPVAPEYFMAALKQNGSALTTFEGFSPSHKREYIQWVTEAKGEDTRKRRLETAIEWMSEGKPRNWKYIKS